MFESTAFQSKRTVPIGCKWSRSFTEQMINVNIRLAHLISDSYITWIRIHGKLIWIVKLVKRFWIWKYTSVSLLPDMQWEIHIKLPWMLYTNQSFILNRSKKKVSTAVNLAIWCISLFLAIQWLGKYRLRFRYWKRKTTDITNICSFM